MRFFSFCIILIYLLSFENTGYSIDAPEIIKKVKQKYDSIESFSADFKQIFKWKLAGETQENAGKVFLKGKDKFRIETEEQLIVSDGNTLWSYSKINNQVIIDNMKNADEVVLPREIFLKYSQKYRPSLLRKEKLNIFECYVLHLVSKTEDVLIKEMKIWVNTKNWITLKIEQVDINQNVTIYILNNIITNKKIDSSKFIYNVPQNVEIIDMR